METFSKLVPRANALLWVGIAAMTVLSLLVNLALVLHAPNGDAVSAVCSREDQVQLLAVLARRSPSLLVTGATLPNLFVQHG